MEDKEFNSVEEILDFFENNYQDDASTESQESKEPETTEPQEQTEQQEAQRTIY